MSGKRFYPSNPGLKSRFNRYLYSEDYTVDEMMGIFDMRAQKAGYQLADDAREALQAILKEESENNIGFGNVRACATCLKKAYRGRPTAFPSTMISQGTG